MYKWKVLIYLERYTRTLPKFSLAQENCPYCIIYYTYNEFVHPNQPGECILAYHDICDLIDPFGQNMAKL